MTFECLKNCGLCCGPVPIKKEIYEKNKGKARPHAMTDLGSHILALQGSTAKCAFLTEENRCSIYDERPDVCRLFGCSEEAKVNCSLACPFLRPDGTIRKRQERRKVVQINNKKAKYMMKQMKKEAESD